MAVSKRRRKPMNVTPLGPAESPEFTAADARRLALGTDDYLRRAGFAIVSRPDVGEPLWRRKGHVSVLRQSAALLLVNLENRRKAAVDEEYAT